MKPFIALDWGTTRIRAALIDGDGSVVEERSGESGVGYLDADGFSVRFDELSLGWNADFAVACGMIGSRQGWCEAPYIVCPANLSNLADHTVTMATRVGTLAIVPGLRIQRDAGSHDVMRGEETQIAGLVAHKSGFSGVVVLPGSHSKWARLENGVVVDFQSFMTGELFHAIARHTVLRHTLKLGEAANEDAFLQGVDAAQKTNGDINAQLFAIRANVLIDGEGDGHQGDFLSGLLIGSEFQSALRSGFDTKQISIVGGNALVSLYEKAAQAAKLAVNIHSGTDLVWPALTMIARNLQNGN